MTMEMRYDEAVEPKPTPTHRLTVRSHGTASSVCQASLPKRVSVARLCSALCSTFDPNRLRELSLSHETSTRLVNTNAGSRNEFARVLEPIPLPATATRHPRPLPKWLLFSHTLTLEYLSRRSDPGQHVVGIGSKMSA